MRITVNSEHDYIDTRRISKGNLRSAIFELILGEMSDIIICRISGGGKFGEHDRGVTSSLLKEPRSLCRLFRRHFGKKKKNPRGIAHIERVVWHHREPSLDSGS